MIIGVAGPYSAATAEQRTNNLAAMNIAAAQVLAKGHIPFIGVNMALPILAQTAEPDNYAAIMKISMAVIDKCDALLLLGESKGALMERDLIATKGLPIYYSITEIPDNN